MNQFWLVVSTSQRYVDTFRITQGAKIKHFQLGQQEVGGTIS